MHISGSFGAFGGVRKAHFSCRALTKVWIMAWKAMMLGLWMSSSRSIAAGSFPGMEEVLTTSSMLSGCAAMPGVHITHSMHEVNGCFPAPCKRRGGTEGTWHADSAYGRRSR